MKNLNNTFHAWWH